MGVGSLNINIVEIKKVVVNDIGWAHKFYYATVLTLSA